MIIENFYNRTLHWFPFFISSSSILEGRSRCHIAWHSDTCFLIGWEKTIQVCYIITPATGGDISWTSTASNDDTESVVSNSTINSTSLIGGVVAVSQYVKLAVQFSLKPKDDRRRRTSDIICGIASHQNRILALLYCPLSFESLLEVQEATESIVSPVMEKLPQLVVFDIGEALNSAPYSTILGDLESTLGGDEDEEDAFEEISREDVVVKGKFGLRDLGLG